MHRVHIYTQRGMRLRPSYSHLNISIGSVRIQQALAGLSLFDSFSGKDMTGYVS